MIGVALEDSQRVATNRAPRDLRALPLAKVAARRFIARLQATLMTKSLAHQLAEFACSLKFEDLSPAVVHEVKRRVIDSFGCALGAWNEEPCVIARKVASDFSAEERRHHYRHQTSGAAGLGRFRDRLLHSLFRLQRHLSFEGTGASERQHRGRARGGGKRRRERARIDHGDRARLRSAMPVLRRGEYSCARMGSCDLWRVLDRAGSGEIDEARLRRKPGTR